MTMWEFVATQDICDLRRNIFVLLWTEAKLISSRLCIACFGLRYLGTFFQPEREREDGVSVRKSVPADFECRDYYSQGLPFEWNEINRRQLYTKGTVSPH